MMFSILHIILQILIFVIFGTILLIYKKRIVQYALDEDLTPPSYFIIAAVIPLFLFYTIYLLLFIRLYQVVQIYVFVIQLMKVISISYMIIVIWLILWNIFKNTDINKK